MHYLVSNGQVVGQGFEDMGLPSGFELVSSDLNLSPEKVYYHQGVIKPIPEKPGDIYFWSGESWVLPTPRVAPEPKPPMTRHELAPKIYDYLKEKDPVMAEVLALALAIASGDKETEDYQVASLAERFADMTE